MRMRMRWVSVGHGVIVSLVEVKSVPENLVRRVSLYART
jgi:hypothetical protein